MDFNAFILIYTFCFFDYIKKAFRCHYFFLHQLGFLISLRSRF